MQVSATKSNAATRQLDVAIDCLFADRDPLAIRTLAAAAFGLLADLADSKNSGSSWREKLISDSGLPRGKAFEVLNGASNFLKHADRDPDAVLSFEEEENDHLIFFATLECGALGHRLSYPMQAFQVWYLACYPEHLGSGVGPVQKSLAILPGLGALERQARLAEGAGFLAQVMAKYANAT